MLFKSRSIGSRAPGTSEAAAEADGEYAAGTTMSLDDLRAAYGLPPR